MSLLAENSLLYLHLVRECVCVPTAALMAPRKTCSTSLVRADMSRARDCHTDSAPTTPTSSFGVKNAETSERGRPYLLPLRGDLLIHAQDGSVTHVQVDKDPMLVADLPS
jgi:hypothetical protein